MNRPQSQVGRAGGDDPLVHLVAEVLRYAGNDELMVSDICGLARHAGFPTDFATIRMVGIAVTSYLLGAGLAELGDLGERESKDEAWPWTVREGTTTDWLAETLSSWLDLDQDPGLGGPFLLRLTESGLEEAMRLG
jgi:hypothetical protein